ncbi:MAG TPA: hypothetical protein VF897_08210 [Roseiflexaceae bacterium]
MDNEAPSTQEWAALYQAAIEFKKLGPWEWMYDSDVFGVQNPEDGQIGYCCVMGNLGEHFALGVYLGAEGLDGYLKIAAGEFDPPDVSLMHYQKCLMASYEDRELLEKKDLATIKELGLKFRGRNAWPMFRSYEPDLLPWFVTASQARFLTVALQQAIDVATRLESDPGLLDPPGEGQYLVRVPEQSAQGTAWTDQWLVPPQPQQEAHAIPPIDELRVQRVKQAIKTRQGAWEADFFLSPTPIQEQRDARPYFPYTLMWVDRRTSMILPPEIAAPDAYRAAFQNHFLTLIEQMRQMPQEVHVAQKEAYDLLDPITSKLGVKLKRDRRLSALEEARASFMSYFS